MNAGNDSVNLVIAQQSQIKIFAADFEDRMFVSGGVFTVTATFADGSAAAATASIDNSAPAIALGFDGQIRDRVGRGEFALTPDGQLDEVFNVVLTPAGGNRTINRVQLNSRRTDRRMEHARRRWILVAGSCR